MSTEDLIADEDVVVPRVTDVYAALPALTGKFELEYEGEMLGGESVARELIRAAVGEWTLGALPPGEWKELHV